MNLTVNDAIDHGLCFVSVSYTHLTLPTTVFQLSPAKVLGGTGPSPVIFLTEVTDATATAATAATATAATAVMPSDGNVDDDGDFCW